MSYKLRLQESNQQRGGGAFLSEILDSKFGILPFEWRNIDVKRVHDISSNTNDITFFFNEESVNWSDIDMLYYCKNTINTEYPRVTQYVKQMSTENTYYDNYNESKLTSKLLDPINYGQINFYHEYLGHPIESVVLGSLDQILAKLKITDIYIANVQDLKNTKILFFIDKNVYPDENVISRLKELEEKMKQLESANSPQTRSGVE